MHQYCSPDGACHLIGMIILLNLVPKTSYLVKMKFLSGDIYVYTYTYISFFYMKQELKQKS